AQRPCARCLKRRDLRHSHVGAMKSARHVLAWIRLRWPMHETARLESTAVPPPFGGVILFVPFLVEMGFNRVIEKAGLPGSKMIPAAHAMRSLLGLKLFGSARHSHVMSDVFDEGLALFAGLNALPKRSFLTEYSCRIDPRTYPTLM